MNCPCCNNQITAGTSTTPSHVVVYREASGRINHAAWRSKGKYGAEGYGQPSDANLKKWVAAYNQSIDGGANKHLPQTAKIVEAVIKRNEQGASTTLSGPRLAYWLIESDPVTPGRQTMGPKANPTDPTKDPEVMEIVKRTLKVMGWPARSDYWELRKLRALGATSRFSRDS